MKVVPKEIRSREKLFTIFSKKALTNNLSYDIL